MIWQPLDLLQALLLMTLIMMPTIPLAACVRLLLSFKTHSFDEPHPFLGV